MNIKLTDEPITIELPNGDTLELYTRDDLKNGQTLWVDNINGDNLDTIQSMAVSI